MQATKIVSPAATGETAREILHPHYTAPRAPRQAPEIINLYHCTSRSIPRPRPLPDRWEREETQFLVSAIAFAAIVTAIGAWVWGWI